MKLFLIVVIVIIVIGLGVFLAMFAECPLLQGLRGVQGPQGPPGMSIQSLPNHSFDERPQGGPTGIAMPYTGPMGDAGPTKIIGPQGPVKE